MTNAPEKLSLAKDHLDRVLAAWGEPTDWKDLSVYGFSCLEAAVDAVSMHVGSSRRWDHTSRELLPRRCTIGLACQTFQVS